VAEHADKRTLPGLSQMPATAVKALIDSLCAAGASGEICAGHLKNAHLTLRPRHQVTPPTLRWRVPVPGRTPSAYLEAR